MNSNELRMIDFHCITLYCGYDDSSVLNGTMPLNSFYIGETA